MKKISFLLMVLVVALASCKKTPEVNLKYVDVERDLVTVGITSANIQCDYAYIATLKKAYLYYGEGENDPNMTSAEMQVVQNTLYVELTGLKENTTYSYYYEFHNGFNSMRTALKTFKTETALVVVTLPTVITAEVTEITTNSAKCGGEVTNDGGAEVTERGICWSKSANPTLTDHHLVVGSGTGSFSAVMDSLSDNITYHVRAYAINEKGTAYGLDKEFVTLSDVPVGAINGLFTINEDGDQVYFSQGNLQYQASTNTWRFAENQWDFVREGNENISPTYDGWIDLFNWGTSGYNHGANCYQPWSISTEPSDYYAYGIETCNLFDQSGEADWGYNSISNGGNKEGLWRTLDINEWGCLLFERMTMSEIRFAKARVNGVDGLIILPDNWIVSNYTLNCTNDVEANFDQNVIEYNQWMSILQESGAVFLPIAGNRIGTSFVYGDSGDYWSSTRKLDYDFAWDVRIKWNLLDYSDGNGHIGQSVRLVQNANP